MSTVPLAERMRPKSLDDYVGQAHLVGPGGVLSDMLASGRISSIIFWGPPGVGKTTLAQIVASQLNRPFYSLSAINSGVKDVRDIIERAKAQRFINSPSPILFIDEIHRFSKAQQDSLLAAVERGVVTLIGATTENPSFEVITPLLSRCQVYILKPLHDDELKLLIDKVMRKDLRFKSLTLKLNETHALFRFAGGDARKLYNILELLADVNGDDETLVIDNQRVTSVLQQHLAVYDKGGEQHYDIISAFIKSVRGSDPHAAVYWLARMLEGGEDPKFIARRLVVLASEDIGLANPNALLLANSCFQAVHTIGMPEARIILSETTIYLATCAKSNSAYQAIETARTLVHQTGNQPVPLHLRNAPTKLMKNLGYGADYQYAHSFEGNFVEQEFLPETLSGTTIYKSQANRHEKEIEARMQALWKDKYK